MPDLSQLTVADVRAVPFGEGLIPPGNLTQRITSGDYVAIRSSSRRRLSLSRTLRTLNGTGKPFPPMPRG